MHRKTAREFRSEMCWIILGVTRGKRRESALFCSRPPSAPLVFASFVVILIGSLDTVIAWALATLRGSANVVIGSLSAHFAVSIREKNVGTLI